jgi:hypothetical protein
MKNSSTIYVIIVLGYILSGCTAIELDSLVPASALPDVIKSCSKPVAQHVAKQKIERMQGILPAELKNDAFINHVFERSRYAAENSTMMAKSLLKPGADTESVPPTPMSKPTSTLTHLDIHGFTKVVTNNVLRRTPSPPNESNSADENAFWTKLRAYYLAYYGGTFYTYFGAKPAKPTLSLTIDDTEIAEAATVFIEFLMDEVLGSPVWVGPDGTYYPGANKNKPTSLTVNNISPIKIKAGPEGCDMNVVKANAINYLATSFSKAASTETNLAIKSAGGIEIGLGVVGKLNIGDNSTLTTLVQTLVSEVVARLTVQFAAPVLEVIDFEKQLAAKGGTLRGLSKVEVSRVITAPFVSGKLAGI